MRLEQLRLENVRGFSTLELHLQPGIHLFVGANGVGKTTLLEAVYMLSRARSFRGAAPDALMRDGSLQMSVFARLRLGNESSHGIGLLRSAGRWQARVDAAAPQNLGELLRLCAVICFEPGSHALISGGSAERRAFLDWGVFHVEPEFLPTWRRYQRALRQRNALLRQGPKPVDLLPWDTALAQDGEIIERLRRQYWAALRPHLLDQVTRLLPELGELELSLASGWAAEGPLLDALQASFQRDSARGFTSVGPHRAEWTLGFAKARKREHLSRGQEKLCALACLLAQARHYAMFKQETPILCLDDLASELDHAHQINVVEALPPNTQVLITGTDVPASLAAYLAKGELALFHVEHGRVQAMNGTMQTPACSAVDSADG